jgi:hypothetical protein
VRWVEAVGDERSDHAAKEEPDDDRERAEIADMDEVGASSSTGSSRSPVAFGSPRGGPRGSRDWCCRTATLTKEGLGPGMQALKPYWQARSANEASVGGFLQLDATRSQYLDGVADATAVNPDLWELDQRYVELPGRDQVMLDLPYDYQNNVKLYPHWHEYLRANQPSALLPWGKNDQFFPPEGGPGVPARST